MQQHVVIAGGGIGGLGAALALARAGIPTTVLEQAHAWGEVGAGIQVGPNVTRVLTDWGIWPDIQACAAFPQRLEVMDAASGRQLGALRLGQTTQRRYGAPYITIHRADLHQVLLQAVQARAPAPMLQSQVTGWQAEDDDLHILVQAPEQDSDSPIILSSQYAPVLIGADGLWSRVRQQLLPGEAAPRYSGILAYRALVNQSLLPAKLRCQVIRLWLGHSLHMVQYPVRAGSHLNVVALVAGARPADLPNWDHTANAADLRHALAQQSSPVRALVDAIDHWRLWPLCDRPPVRSAQDMAQGAIALLGDAAHPMRPFMAQGACMALEDAAVLSACIQSHGTTPAALAQYAQQRWKRCARVQQRSIRNGHIFHSQGLMRVGRDWSIKLLGERLLDVPWLYGHQVPLTPAPSA